MLQLQLFKNKNITNRIRELIVRVCSTAAQMSLNCGYAGISICVRLTSAKQNH